MQLWIDNFMGIVRMLFGQPGSIIFVGSLIILVAAYLWSANRTANSFDIKRNETEWIVLGAILGSAILISAVIAARIYLKIDLASWMVDLGAIAISFLILVVPLHCLIQRGKYLDLLPALLSRILATIVAILIFNGVVRIGSSGLKAFNKAQHDSVEKYQDAVD